MHASRFFITTLKEAPADAEIVSHRLMLRAGLIKRLAGGIYTYMPMGLRVIRKVEGIVRDEMNRAGAIELLMPVVQPAELWQESGRWEKYGPELLRIKDRHQRDFVVQPTSEEVITDIARKDIASYKQLPVNLYHIQTKFRDEIRPRFGVMRGREFTMKDAYSFDRDFEGLQRSYEKMRVAYCAIFERMGLRYRGVAADNGSIGGTGSQEFHVLADSGEDAIAFNPQSDYAANVELAEAIAPHARAPASEPMNKVSTPGRAKCEDVAALLGIPLERTVKSIVLAVDATKDVADTKIHLLLLRGDHVLNEIKTRKLDGLSAFRFASEAEIVDTFGTPPGYLGPIATKRPVTVIADRTVAAMSDFVVGANEVDFHIAGVNWGRDLPEPIVADIRNVKAGDAAPDGPGTLELCRGIEVGHIFQLRTVYSKPEALNATFLDEDGKPKPFEMGCYGIGITRVVGAAIEQNFDERGIVWPRALAPFEVVLCPVGWGRNEHVREAAIALHDALVAQGVDVILDDRDLRPGVMFADWELIGVPLRVTIGDRGLKDGNVEVQARRDAAATDIPLGEAAAHVIGRLASL